jgi:hypothetical protein
MYLFEYELLNNLIMNKKILYFIVVAAIALVAGWNINQNKSEVALSDMTMTNVEALASCETSSSASNNGGYCISNYGSSGDSCVTQSANDAVRCNGNY